MPRVPGHARAPDRQGDRDREPLDGDRVRGHGVVAALGQVGQAVRSGSRGDHPELLAAEPGERVRRAQRGRDPCCNLAQHLVAHRVSVPVVHHLEAIDIDHQDAHGRAAREGVGRRPLQPPFERPPVRDAGELVGFRERVHVGGQPAAIADRQVQAGEQDQQPDRADRPVGGRDPEDVSVDEDRDDQHEQAGCRHPRARRLQACPRGFAAAEQERGRRARDHQPPADLPAGVDPAAVGDAAHGLRIRVDEPAGRLDHDPADTEPHTQGRPHRRGERDDDRPDARHQQERALAHRHDDGRGEIAGELRSQHHRHRDVREQQHDHRGVEQVARPPQRRAELGVLRREDRCDAGQIEGVADRGLRRHVLDEHEHRPGHVATEPHRRGEGHPPEEPPCRPGRPPGRPDAASPPRSPRPTDTRCRRGSCPRCRAETRAGSRRGRRRPDGAERTDDGEDRAALRPGPR